MDWFPFTRKKRQQKAQALELYTAIVEMSRNPDLFVVCQIPDTVDGRFDVLSLHLFLVLRRVKQEEGQDDFADEVASVFATDMDRNLREMGVGDLSVGKHVKKMSAAFMGRFMAYDKALDQDDREQLTAALKRNIFRDAPVDPALLDNLQVYVLKAYDALRATSLDDLLAAKVPSISVNKAANK